MLPEITVKLKYVKRFYVEGDANSIVFDNGEGNILYYQRQMVADFEGDFIFTNPKITHSKKHHMATVVFQTGGKQYDYFCDIAGISAGDKVIVNSPYHGETEVTVIKISEKSETELILPLEKYKSILRKA